MRNRQERQTVQRPQAYVPGEGVPPPRNAHDIAWSEFNHHWAGILVCWSGLPRCWTRPDGAAGAALAVGFPGPGRLPPAPSGSRGLAAGPDQPAPEHAGPGDGAAQAVGAAGGGIRAVGSGRFGLAGSGGRVRFVFPVGMLAGGVLLLTTRMRWPMPKEALLVDIRTCRWRCLALIGGCAAGRNFVARRNLVGVALWTWPLCLVVIGLLLISYREASSPVRAQVRWAPAWASVSPIASSRRSKS